MMERIYSNRSFEGDCAFTLFYPDSGYKPYEFASGGNKNCYLQE